MGLTLGSLALSGAAEEIGNAVRVHPEVRGYGVGEQERDIRQNDPIERGLKVFLRGPDPYLKVAFNFGGCEVLQGARNHRFTGTASLAGVSEVDFGDPNDPSVSRIKLAVGTLHLKALGEAGCHRPEIETPHAILTLGTVFRVLVSPILGTFVAVDGGATTVQAKAGGASVVVKAGNWVLVPPGGLPTRPAPLPRRDDDEILQDPPLLGCCDVVEPRKPPGH
jgi:hypothetical protein